MAELWRETQSPTFTSKIRKKENVESNYAIFTSNIYKKKNEMGAHVNAIVCVNTCRPGLCGVSVDVCGRGGKPTREVCQWTITGKLSKSAEICSGHVVECIVV